MYKDKDFPKYFKFEKINDTIKIKATCQEIFPYTQTINCMVFLMFPLFIISMGYIFRWILPFLSSSENLVISLHLFLLVPPIVFFILLSILSSIIIKFYMAEYTFSSAGIEIRLGNSSIFIKKEDIKDVYLKSVLLNVKIDKYKKEKRTFKYLIYVEFLKFLDLNERLRKLKLSLFSDYKFTDENLVNYMVTEIKTALFKSEDK